MKKLSILLILGLLCFSCKKDPVIKPKANACFDYAPQSGIKVGDTLHFSNCSKYATSYNWDFGDGTASTDSTPNHSYETGGTFSVTLLTSNDHSGDTLTIVINVRELTKTEMLCLHTWSLYSAEYNGDVINLPDDEIGISYLYNTFNANGTMSREVKANNIIQTTTGSWSMSDTTLTFELPDGIENNEIFSLTQQKMVLVYEDINWFYKPKN
jgi:PKD repeat protein